MKRKYRIALMSDDGSFRSFWYTASGVYDPLPYTLTAPNLSILNMSPDDGIKKGELSYADYDDLLNWFSIDDIEAVNKEFTILVQYCDDCRPYRNHYLSDAVVGLFGQLSMGSDRQTIEDMFSDLFAVETWSPY